MLCSAQGLANGIWSFVLSPVEVSRDLVDTFKSIHSFIQDHTIYENLRACMPEIEDLKTKWDSINELERGKLIGNLVGKYGTDAFLMAGTAKGVKLFQEMRMANATMTLESMKTLEKRKKLESISNSWKAKTNEGLKKIKTDSIRNDKALYRKYRDANLSEHQVRKILHTAGYESFSRPKGIPRNYKVEISQKNGGMLYVDPKNRGKSIRIMPGNPKSPNPAQRKPYVIQTTDDMALDKLGNRVARKSPEAHIPLEDFVYRE